MHNVIYGLSQKNPDLKTGEIVGILHILMNTKTSITNGDLVRFTGLPKSVLKVFKSSLAPFLENKQDDTISLSDNGKQLFADIPLLPYQWTLVSLTKDYSEEITKLKELRKKYDLTPKREYDQFFATEETSINKALILMEKDQVQNKHIALLGDDDLVSITLGLLNINNLSSYKVTVFDIDPDILAIITGIANDLGIKNVQAEQIDLRRALKSQFLNKYDVVMTDPPYTKAGISLFVNKSTQMLYDVKDDAGIYLFLCFGASLKDSEKYLKIQEIINKYNYVIEDKVDKFNRYYGAESVGSASSLYILKKTKQSKALDEFLKTQIYTFENTSEERFPYVDHLVFKLFNVPSQILTSKKALLKACGAFCTYHSLKVLDTKITKFKGGGHTIVFVLSTSNLTIHTWPEFNALHMVIVTCEPIAKRDFLYKNLSSLFKTTNIEITTVE